MKKPFTCECGTRTTAPFLINGRHMCTLCAEEFHPGVVSKRASRDWNDFVNSRPKLRRQARVDQRYNY
jgi:hypothetical protein